MQNKTEKVFSLQARSKYWQEWTNHHSIGHRWGQQFEEDWENRRCFRDDHTTSSQASTSSTARPFNRGSVRLIWGSIHLLFQRVNRRIQGGKLTLNPIAPHRKHGVLALLVLPLHSSHVHGRGAAERRKHRNLVATQAWLIFFPDVTTIFDWQPLKLALSWHVNACLRWCRREAKECGDSFHESH